MIPERHRGAIDGLSFGLMWFGISTIFALIDGPRPWQTMLAFTVLHAALMLAVWIGGRRRTK